MDRPRLRRPRWTRQPLLILAVLCVLSLAARAGGLGQPCYSPCGTSTDHLLIFDEDYYVNAARVIAGINPPRGAPYAGAPLGDDPNAEHPQLAKLVVAGMVEWLGDGPVAWRMPSLIVGTICLLGMYALARAAGAGAWLAVGSAALMATDNLLLVHGRIATLDIYVLAGMLWGVTAYLRGRPLLAGALLGVAAASKMVGPYALAVVGLIEVIGYARSRDGLLRRVGRLGVCVAATGGVLIGLLALFDRIAPPYDNSAGRRVGGGVFGHLAHMFSYAAAQTSPHGPTGIASYPWQWLWDFKPIVYLNIDPSSPSPGLYNVHPAVHFLGVASPPTLLFGTIGALGAIAVGLWRAARGGHWSARGRRGPRGGGAPAAASPWGWRGSRGGGAPAATALGRSHARPQALGVATTGTAWFLGTYLPFVVVSLLYQRTSYLYYMVIVMPGLYLTAADVAARVARRGRWVWLTRVWMLAVAAAVVLMYPFTPI